VRRGGTIEDTADQMVPGGGDRSPTSGPCAVAAGLPGCPATRRGTCVSASFRAAGPRPD